MAGLTNKQQAFVSEYLVDFNATQAAIRVGYSEKSARNQAHRMITNDDISKEIKARIEEKSMTANEVLLRLADMARGDMGDFLDISSMGFVVDLANAKEKGLTKLIKKVKQRTTITSKDGAETEVHDIEIELYDAQAALVQLGRKHALFIDKQEVTKKSYNVTVDGETIEDE